MNDDDDDDIGGDNDDDDDGSGATAAADDDDDKIIIIIIVLTIGMDRLWFQSYCYTPITCDTLLTSAVSYRGCSFVCDCCFIL